MENSVVIPKYLHQLILMGEGETLDFKYSISDPRKIAITLSAFANTRGGTLLIGIRDNGTVAGSNYQEDAHMLHAAAELYCRPHIDFSLNTWKASGKYVLEAIIQQSAHRPVMAEAVQGEWRAYMRRNDENFPAPGVFIQFWKMEETPIEERYNHSPREQKVFELLNEGRNLSVSQLARAVDVHPKEMSTLLAKLLRWGLIDCEFDHGIARYKLLN